MGCSDSRSGLTKEERAIVDMESMLNYYHNNCKAIDFYIRKYSYAGEINPEQWRDVVNHLGLKVDHTVQNPKVGDFINSFRGSEGRLPIKPMLILGIMLGSGASRDKARLLFETQDVRNSKSLLKTDIHELVELMVDIAVNRLPSLAIKTQNVSEEEIRNYLVQLHQNIDRAKSSIVRQFIGTETKAEESTVTLAAFEKNFADESNANLLTPYGIRMFISKHQAIEIKTKKSKEDKKHETTKTGEKKDKSSSSSDSSSSDSSDEEKKKKKVESAEPSTEVAPVVEEKPAEAPKTENLAA